MHGAVAPACNIQCNYCNRKYDCANEARPGVVSEKLTPEQERFYRASQWRIMWWKFKRHRIAVFCAAILLAVYASILVSEILAPYNLHPTPYEFALYYDV